MNLFRFRTVQAVLILISFQSPVHSAKATAFPAKGANMSLYKTYRLLPTRVLTKTGVVENDDKYCPIVNSAVRKEMALKGFTEVNANEDLQVAAGALRSASAQLEAILFSWGIYADFGTDPVMTLGRYNFEGTLVVNMIDPKTKKTVWAAVANQPLRSASQLQSDVDKAARALFKKYPGKKQ